MSHRTEHIRDAVQMEKNVEEKMQNRCPTDSEIEKSKKR